MKLHFAAALLLATSVITATPSAPLMQRIMNAADKDKDGKLALEEFKRLDVQAVHHGDEHFKAGDTDSDGFIAADELAHALKKQTWFSILSEGIESCFARLDANKDSKLDALEYRNISKMGAHSMQHFKGADTSKDGFLNLTEFTAHAEGKLKRVEGGVTTKKPTK
ncbi:MAG: EF-hand domain-containing protein [Prosthecobacter sp.]|uniref:EF-hand domain-containing protein n=1 Tax=Prosthecobacter sp. TaxID=1965333 RepID=UPI0038FF7082